MMSIDPILQGADLIFYGFSEYRSRFTEITRGASQRFMDADWAAVQESAAERINLYDQSVHQVIKRLAALNTDLVDQHSFWNEVCQRYAELISYRTDPELAETFYNSVYRGFCRITSDNDSECDFTLSRFSGFAVHSPGGIYRTYSLHKKGLMGLINQLFDDFSFDLPWEYRRRDICYIARTLKQEMVDFFQEKKVHVDILKWVFYRNKSACLIGRITAGQRVQPFVLPVLNNEQGALYVDTLLCDNDSVSQLFSFSRAYFMVDARYPSECMTFLQSLLPDKPLWEMYSFIGCYHHGKTVFYRDFLTHLEASSDQFVIAPGVRGLVMSVFTLPSLNIVFKLIRDRCALSKNVNRRHIQDRYRLVKVHDRVGRMADTQEFFNLKMPRYRFSESLLAELRSQTKNCVDITDKYVLLKHVYVERRMTPLNIFLQKADERAKQQALEEYGNAIKQLAAANIFPGDMLLKNFGVTRHGRVVFYDYDEICYLTECRFRRLPKPLYPEQEMACDPWFSVGPDDVFPEEWPVFLLPDKSLRRIFETMHGDMFSCDFWQNLQQKIREGCVVDVFSYRKDKRFSRRIG
ncbi:Isocitrate dehydrogenase kinase/phosphatase [invertebrate metagenome]|uniref:Isocitrate dehydrogenase kinase/phosphatase n=1 Tax=invertebrate metagenome TaxID=1711999 RepID=A0A2H9T590_9ZZZZ